MGVVIAIVVVVGLVWANAAYNHHLRQGFRPRVVITTLEDQQLGELFERHVAHAGWHLESPAWPLVAQSPLLTGIRQQIQLSIGTDARHPGAKAVQIQVSRFARKRFSGSPTKAHTLRIRIEAFLKAVQAADPQAVVEEVQ